MEGKCEAAVSRVDDGARVLSVYAAVICVWRLAYLSARRPKRCREAEPVGRCIPRLQLPMGVDAYGRRRLPHSNRRDARAQDVATP
jgi:hypothetical protein